MPAGSYALQKIMHMKRRTKADNFSISPMNLMSE